MNKFRKTIKVGGVPVDAEPKIIGLNWNEGSPYFTMILSYLGNSSEISKQNLTTGFTLELQARLDELIEELYQKLLDEGFIEYDSGGIETEIEGRVGETISRIRTRIIDKVGTGFTEVEEHLRSRARRIRELGGEIIEQPVEENTDANQ